MLYNCIKRHVRIKSHSVFVNGTVCISMAKDEIFNVFAKTVYKQLGLEYAKFFKMDKLSKLGFLASEILLQGQNIPKQSLEKAAIILANSSSSLSTDINYQETINEIPSPAVFVYTLPNIVIGEICIRNGIKGEAAFFVQQQFDISFMAEYISGLFTHSITETCIAGWMEYGIDNNYDVFLMLIEKNVEGNELSITKEAIESLYLP